MKRVECLRAYGGREVQRVICAETKQEECEWMRVLRLFFFLKIESMQRKNLQLSPCVLDVVML